MNSGCVVVFSGFFAVFDDRSVFFEVAVVPRSSVFIVASLFLFVLLEVAVTTEADIS